MKNEKLKDLEKMKSTLEKSIKDKLSELNKMNKELDILNDLIEIQYGGKKRVVTKKSSHKSIGLEKSEIPLIYDKNMVLRKKIIFVINKQKQCTIKDIADAISKLEKNIKYESVYPQVQQAVIKLLSNNKLNKIGDYNSKYELKI